MIVKTSKDLLFAACCFWTVNIWADTVLVQVGSAQVTDRQLEKAMRAAPFATQFPAMDEKDQAYLRGDMLLRLARAEALYQEAEAQGINQSPQFRQEMANFTTTLLAQRYLDELRSEIKVPTAVEDRLRKAMPDQTGSLEAARSAYIAKQFAAVKRDRLAALEKQADIKRYPDRLEQTPTRDTVLASIGEVTIQYGDLIPPGTSVRPDPETVRRKIDDWLQQIVLARAAIAQGITVDRQLQDYAKHLAVQFLLAEKEKQWLPDEQALADYFRQHPKLGYIPERRQIGQIVVASQAEAERLRGRIAGGESLFDLAAQYSIDPYGREHSGDMGWLQAGSGAEAIETALKTLPDQQVSEPIQTAKGWHLVMIVNRKPSEQKDFAAVKDRVRQKFLAGKMRQYLQSVFAKYPLEWKLGEHVGVTQLPSDDNRS